MSGDAQRKLVILMFNMFIANASFGIIIPILPEYLHSIHQGGTAAGLLIAFFAGSQLLFSPLAGKWADQYGRRKIIIYGLGILSFSMVVFYMTDLIWIHYLSRAIGGLGAAMLIPAIFAYIADITTVEQRAKGHSLISAAMSLGIVIGPGIGGFLANAGLKMPFLAAAIGSAAAVIFSFILLGESKKQEHESPKEMQPKESLYAQLVLSVKLPYFIPLLISLVMSFGLVGYESVLSLFMESRFEASPQQIAVMITSTGLVSVIVQLLFVEKLVRKLGEYKTIHFFLGLAALSFFLSLLVNQYELFFVITLLIFLATSILRPVVTALISKLAGEKQGFAMGLNNAYMSVGNILGPAIAGVVYDVNRIYPFILSSVFIVVTMIITMIWQKSMTRNNRTEIGKEWGEDV